MAEDINININQPDGPASGGSSKGDKYLAKQTKLLEEAKKNDKVRHKESIAKAVGVNISLASVLKQSQVFTGTLGSIFQILGALVDVILAPFLPYIVPAIRRMADWIPRAAKFAQALAERVGPLISDWLGRVFDVIDVFATGFVGSVTEALNKGDWGILFDFIKDTLVTIKDWALDYWEGLKDKYPWLQRIEDTVVGLYQWLVTNVPKAIPFLRDLVTQAGIAYLFLKDRFIQLYAWLTKNIPVIWDKLGEWFTFLRNYFKQMIHPYLEKAWEWTKWGFNALKTIADWGFKKLGALADAMPVLIEALKIKLVQTLGNLSIELGVKFDTLKSTLMYLSKQLTTGLITLIAVTAGGAMPAIGGVIAAGAVATGAAVGFKDYVERQEELQLEEKINRRLRAAQAEMNSELDRRFTAKMMAAQTLASQGGSFGALNLGDMPQGFTNREKLEMANFRNAMARKELAPEKLELIVEFKNDAYNDAKRGFVQDQYNGVQLSTNYSKGVIKDVMWNEKLNAYDLTGL